MDESQLINPGLLRHYPRTCERVSRRLWVLVRSDTVVVLGYYLGFRFLLSFLFRICSTHTLSSRSFLCPSLSFLCSASWCVR